MADFNVKVTAQLDTSKLSSQLKQAFNQNFQLNNITVNTSSLISAIQGALNSHQFQINIGNPRQMAQQGTQAGQNYAQNFANATTRAMGRVQRVIGGVNTNVSRIRTSNTGRFTTQTVTGRDVNNLHDIYQETTRIENATGNIMGTTRVVTRNFDDGAKAAQSMVKQVARANKAFSDGSMVASTAKIASNYENLLGSGHSGVTALSGHLAEMRVQQEAMTSARAQGNMRAFVQAYDRYNSSLSQARNLVRTINAENSTFTKASNITSLGSKIQKVMDGGTVGARKYGQQLQSIQDQLNASNGRMKKTEYNRLKDEYTGLQAQIDKYPQIATMGDVLKGSLSGMGRAIWSMFGVTATINGAKQMYENVKNVDSAMVELRKVTDETDATYTQFLSNGNKRAQEIGTTITGYINSTADFARLGFGFNEAQELSKVANIYTVVGDEVEDVGQASSSIISTLKAFYTDTKDAGADAMSIIDKFNEVGNKQAISSGGIGEAMLRSASSFAAANNTIDQSIALIAAANTIAQDPASVGKRIMPTIKITISVKSQRWSRPRKDFVDIVTRQLGRACFLLYI